MKNIILVILLLISWVGFITYRIYEDKKEVVIRDIPVSCPADTDAVVMYKKTNTEAILTLHCNNEMWYFIHE